MTGTIKTLRAEKGFGFIKDERGLVGDARLVASGAGVAGLFLALFRFAARCLNGSQNVCRISRVTCWLVLVCAAMHTIARVRNSGQIRCGCVCFAVARAPSADQERKRRDRPIHGRSRW